MRLVLLIVVAAAAVLGSVLAIPAPAPPMVEADHYEGPADFAPPLIRSPIMRAWQLDPVGKIESASGGNGIPALVRNLMALETSGAVPVCASAKYAEATRRAVAKWNTSLRTSDVVKARNILRYVPGGVFACPAAPWGGSQLANIIVLDTTRARGCAHPGAVACAVPGGIKGDPEFTYVGTTTLFFSEAALATEFTFSGSDAAANELAQRAAIIAHEIGHALGFPHVYEDFLGEPGTGRTRCPGIFPGVPASLAAIMLPGPCASADLTSYDHETYRQAYRPGKVTVPTVTNASETTLQVSWDDGDVHVAGAFLVQYRTTAADVLPERWATLKTLSARSAGESSARSAIVFKPVTERTFRIVSATDAFGLHAPRAASISGAVTWKAPAKDLKTYELNVTHGNNGDVSPEGKSSRTEGATVMITASPNSGYVVNGWSASDPSAGNARVTLPASCSGTPTPITCSVTMDGPRHVHVTFKVKPAVTPEPTVAPTTTPKPTPTPTTKPEEPQEETKQCLGHTLTVKASGVGRALGGGTYGRKVVGINEDCPTPTASPTASWNSNTHTFEGWSGACSGTTCSVTMDGPKTVTATFKERTYTFTVTATGGGSASGGGTGYKYNAKASATASWNKTSYVFRGWSGACSGTSATCSTTMTSNKSATASFAKRYCYVTARVGTGSGSVSGGGNVHCGVGSMTVTARASSGYCFSSWGGGLGGENAEQQSTCPKTASTTFTKPVTAVTAIANFKKEPVTYYTLTVTSGSGSGKYKAGTYATAMASEGRCFLGTTYTFKRWSGDSTSTSRVVRLYMSRNKAVTAVYTVGGSCQRSEESVEADDGGGPAWTEAPATEPADDP